MNPVLALRNHRGMENPCYFFKNISTYIPFIIYQYNIFPNDALH